MAMKVSEIYDRLEGRTDGQERMPVAVGDLFLHEDDAYRLVQCGRDSIVLVGPSKISEGWHIKVSNPEALTEIEARRVLIAITSTGKPERVSDGLTIEQIYAPVEDVEPIKIRQYFVCYGRAYTLVRDSGNKVILCTVGGEWHGWAGWSEVVDALNITRAEWEDIIGHSTKPVIRVSWQELTTFYKKCLGL